jgi:DNA polymerase-3 subunit epsilon
VAKVTDTLAMAREMFPGKSNSLDALCRRLEVDNTQRTLHGALLDAGLLAEVYIRMTRGQDSLVIDGTASSSSLGGPAAQPLADLRAFALHAVAVSEEERAAHDAMLADLDAASGGKTVWRRMA